MTSISKKGRRAGGRKIVLHMIANAHLDPVWLWNWQAGVDEALATFRSAADRCDEYPDLHYTRGESWLYEVVERLDPALFQRVLRAIRRGQWHVTGGQYVQPDTNLPTEAGWHRQLATGLAYFRKKLKQRTTIGYNVDSFGHPATLPDILRSHGMRGYVFHRPSEAQQALPGLAFRWRGPRGGEVVAYRITPCYVTRTDDLYGQIMSVLDACAGGGDTGHAMVFYGLGNHGGGPSKASIEYIREHRHAFPGAVLEFSHPERYFDAISARKGSLPLYEGELQHTFPGCYSVMHDIKQAQHRNEYKLSQGERLLRRKGLPAPFAKSFVPAVEAAWKDLLFTQFHDILAGTSIPSAWTSVRAKQGRALAAAEEAIVAATRRWARAALPAVNRQQIVAVNSEPFAFDGHVAFEPYIDFDDWGRRWISTLDGKPVPFQLVQPEANLGAMTHGVVFPARIAPGGHAVFLVRDDAPPAGTAVKAPARAQAGLLTDGATGVALRPDGIAVSSRGREVLARVGLRLIEDKGDTWVFHSDRFDGPEVAAPEPLRWTVEEDGPLRARAYAEGRIADSVARWTVDVPRGEGKVRLSLEIHFRERHRLLQLDVRAAAPVRAWRAGLPGGHAARKPDAAEWPVQKWLAARAFALVTPDAYGVSHGADGCRWSLLRAPLMAWAGQGWPEPGSTIQHADQGVHRFEFEIHPGPRTAEELDAAHRFLVCPPVLFDRYEGMNRPPWGNHPPRRLWTPDVARARRDGRLAHLADAEGPRNWEESPRDERPA